MKSNKLGVFLFVILLLLPILWVPVSAEEQPTFRYELTVDGQDTIEVSTGDIITVALYLYRTDSNSLYTMYAMQDEIRYDSEFFELVEDSAMLSNGIHSTDISVGGGFREFYMNYVSFSGGAQWQPKMRIGTFQLRVIGSSGVATITNEDYLVSHQDGMGGYDCKANKLTVILSNECEVKFESNGGTKIDPVMAIFGEKLDRPDDPVREGKYFVGWYKDIHLTQEWDFDTDVVSGNMKLYAKWSSEPLETTPGDESSDGSDTGSGEDSVIESMPSVDSDVSDDSFSEKTNCMICGKESYSFICARCFLMVGGIALLVIVLILVIVLFLIFRRAKRKKSRNYVVGPND